MNIKKYTQPLFSWYQPLPAWAKGLVILGTLSTAVYSVHYTVKSIKAKKAREKSQRDLISYVNDLDKLAKQGIYPSFQKSQYLTWVSGILEQFTGCDASFSTCPQLGFGIRWSSSGFKVNNILSQLKNDADFLALQAAWGIKTYDECGIWTGNVENVSLTGAITNELTDCEIVALNKTLQSKNITYKF